MWTPALLASAVCLLVLPPSSSGRRGLEHALQRVDRLCTRFPTSSVCESLHRRKRSEIDALLPSELLSEASRMQLPGTKWCGAGDDASGYDDLGSAKDTDRCCRAHDFCPVYLSPGQSGGGVTNTSPFTVVSCACEATFFICLKHTGTAHSQLAGELYFNVLDKKCLVPGTSGAWDGTGEPGPGPGSGGDGDSSGSWTSAKLVPIPWSGQFPEPKTPELEEQGVQIAARSLQQLLHPPVE